MDANFPSTLDAFKNYCLRLQPLNEASWKGLESILHLAAFPKGSDIQRIGQACRNLYFVQSGLARIYYRTEGHEITEHFAKENQWVIRVESLFTDRPSRKGIQALEDSQLVVIPALPLRSLYDEFPMIERLFRKVFELIHLDTVNRLESLQFQQAADKYQDLIQQQPDLLQRVPLKYIASFLGITPESLSRLRKQWH